MTADIRFLLVKTLKWGVTDHRPAIILSAVYEAESSKNSHFSERFVEMACMLWQEIFPGF